MRQGREVCLKINLSQYIDLSSHMPKLYTAHDLPTLVTSPDLGSEMCLTKSASVVIALLIVFIPRWSVSHGRCQEPDYGKVIANGTEELDKEKDFIDPILVTLDKALDDRLLEYVRVTGPGSMCPCYNNGHKGSVLQISLALKIFNRYKKKSNTKFVFEEINMTRKEMTHLSKYGENITGTPSCANFHSIPPKIIPKNGVTLLYFIGAPPKLLESLLRTYAEHMDNVILITDNLKTMTDKVIDQHINKVLINNHQRPLQPLQITALREDPTWNTVLFSTAKIGKYFGCQGRCAFHQKTAIQWKINKNEGNTEQEKSTPHALQQKDDTASSQCEGIDDFAPWITTGIEFDQYALDAEMTQSGMTPM